MLHTVKKVEHVEGYKLKLHFDDKSVKIVDLEYMFMRAKNLLAQLAEVEYFKKVRCDGTTIYWPNGVDLCPDVLYKIGEKTLETKAKKKTSIRRTKIRKTSKLKAPCS